MYMFVCVVFMCIVYAITCSYITDSVSSTLHTQVKNSAGEYITVPHIDDALQVNIGAIMQRWTADKYIAPVGWIRMWLAIQLTGSMALGQDRIICL